MSSLDKLTLIMPSYTRQPYLVRSLQYWSNKAPTIIALDGSPDPINKSALEGLGCNVFYCHAPVSFMERIKMVESKLKTPYVALLADDDFYLPSALTESIEFLDKHADYSACIGRPVGFGYEEEAGVFGIPGVYADMYNDYGVYANTPGRRMHEHMGRYMPSTMYAVLRTKNWGKIVEGYIRREFPVFAIVELQMEIATAYLGKSVVLPILGWLKSTELEQISGPDLSLQRTNEFHDLWPTSNGDARFRAEFSSTMSNLLCCTDQRSQEIVASEIEGAMDAYVEWCHSYFRKTVSFYGIREYLKCALPEGVTNLITKHLREHRLRRSVAQPKQSLLLLGQQIKASGTYVDMNELQDIVDYVQRFHTGRCQRSLTN